MFTLDEIKKCGIRLVAIDLDGTMLNSNKQLTERTKNAFIKANEAGIIIVPATGRHYNAVPEELFEIPGIRYALAMSGAALYDKKTDSCIHKDEMEYGLAMELMDEFKKYDILIDAFIGDKAYRSECDMDFVDKLAIPEAMKKFVKNSREAVPDLYEYIEKNRFDVFKFILNFAPDENGVLIHRNEIIEMLKKYENIGAVSGGHNNLEVTMATANKGTGVLKLGELLGITQDKIMAIGDAGNDYDMIVAAKVGVAMANSEDEILKAADFVTCSNDEDGVAYVIENLI